MEKIILFLCIILLLLSCDEQEEDNFRFYNWESVQDKIYNDSLILELGIDLNNYDGIILNELNYNLFGDGELYRNSLYMYFNYDNNTNNIINIKLNYSKLEEGVFKNNFYSLIYFKSDEFYNNISFFNNNEKVNLDIKKFE